MQVGIVVPAWNVAGYWGDTLASVLVQTHAEWRLVVVDGGSTDGTADVVKAVTDPRIDLVRQANAGVSAARNRGLQALCHAVDAVLFLDGDDWLAADALVRLAVASCAAPKAVAAVGPWASGERVRQPARGSGAHGVVPGGPALWGGLGVSGAAGAARMVCRGSGGAAGAASAGAAGWGELSFRVRSIGISGVPGGDRCQSGAGRAVQPGAIRRVAGPGRGREPVGDRAGADPARADGAGAGVAAPLGGVAAERERFALLAAAHALSVLPAATLYGPFVPYAGS